MEETVVTEHGEEDDRNRNVFPDLVTEQVFSDWKIWRRLGRMLNFSDLKDCRMVCKAFNDMVVGESNFKSRALVTLTPSTMKPEVFGTTEILFKNFNLKLDPKELSKYGSINCEKKTKRKRGEDGFEEMNNPFSWFYPHLQEAEYLCVRMVRREGIQKLMDKRLGLIFDAMQKFPEAAKKLKHLGLELGFIFFGKRQDETSFLENFDLAHAVLSRWRSTGIQLDSFELLDAGEEWLTYESFDGSYHNNNMFRVGLLCLDIRSFNLPHMMPIGYKSIFRAFNLTLKERTTRHGIVGLADVAQRTNIQKIQRISTHRLEDLSLDETHQLRIDPHPRYKPLKTVCPNLRGVEAREFSACLPEFCQYFRCQPDLEEISVNVEYGPLTANLVQAIAEKSSKLRKLCLRASRFDSALQNPSYWSFPKQTKLREFVLMIEEFPDPDGVVRHNGFGFPREALKSLPATVREIVIGGIPDWMLDRKIAAHDFAGICPKTLTELTLSSCGGCIDDGTVEYICKNFKMLQKLDLTGASLCTDDGFTGIPSGTCGTTRAGFPISSLKGLKKLILRGCSAITDVTLEGITFQELNHLDLVGVNKVTPVGIQAVLAQNPSLETLLTSDVTVLKEKTEFIAKHPRLKSIAEN